MVFANMERERIVIFTWHQRQTINATGDIRYRSMIILFRGGTHEHALPALPAFGVRSRGAPHQRITDIQERWVRHRPEARRWIWGKHQANHPQGCFPEVFPAAYRTRTCPTCPSCLWQGYVRCRWERSQALGDPEDLGLGIILHFVGMPEGEGDRRGRHTRLLCNVIHRNSCHKTSLSALMHGTHTRVPKP